MTSKSEKDELITYSQKKEIEKVLINSQDQDMVSDSIQNNSQLPQIVQSIQDDQLSNFSCINIYKENLPQDQIFQENQEPKNYSDFQINDHNQEQIQDQNQEQIIEQEKVQEEEKIREEEKHQERKIQNEIDATLIKKEIPGTNYAFYSRNLNTLLPLQLDQNQLNFIIGAIRSQSNSTLKYNHGLHSNQYDQIAKFVIDHCQDLMENTYKLKKVYLPLDKFLDEVEAKEQQNTNSYFQQNVQQKYPKNAKVPVFMSPEFIDPNEEQKQRNKNNVCLVLIQGTGAVRAGIWARSVCINDNFYQGSQITQVDWAFQKKYPVLVMNPNQNSQNGKTIPFNQSMQNHACHVWEQFVEPSGFENILLIAHSAGGGCVSSIQKNFVSTFYQKVKKIAYTDSWVASKYQLNKSQQNFMMQNAVHYVASNHPLGKILGVECCIEKSAGHNRHEYTTGCAWPEIQKLFEETNLQKEVVDQQNKDDIGQQNVDSNQQNEGNLQQIQYL